MRTAVIDFAKDLGTEPEPDRGVALDKPIELEAKLEGKKPEKEIKEEIAEGQPEVPGEGQETPEGEQPEGEEAAQAEGHPPKLKAKDFADQAGWSLEEFYRDVLVPTDDGEATLSEVVDGYKSLRAENEKLQQERQQVEAKATQPAMQQYDPRAVELISEVQKLQKDYDAALNDGTFDGMEAAEAMRLQMRYKDAIDQRTRAAQQIQGEYGAKYQAWAKELEINVDAEIRDKIKEFRNPKVRAEQTGAMKDMVRSEYGVDDGRWNGMLMDPLSMRMIHDLWTMKAKQAEVQKGVRKILKVPKALKPAARQGKAGLQSAGDVGKAISSAKGRRQQDKILFESEFDDSLLR
jgi:hypothetical protein